MQSDSAILLQHLHHVLEYEVAAAGQPLVAEVRVEHLFFRRSDLVVRRKLGRRRADRIHESRDHQNPAADARRKILHIDVAEPLEKLLFMCVRRVELTEIILQFFVCRLGQIHVPDPPVVRQKRIHGTSPVQFRNESGTGEREAASLRSAHRADPRFVNIVHRHDQAGQPHRIEINIAEQQFLRIGIIHAADDVSAQRCPGNWRHILRKSALAAHIERRHCEAGVDVTELVAPVPGIAGVSVKLHNRRMFPRRFHRTQQFGVNPRSARSCEPQIEAFGVRSLELRRRQFQFRWRRLKFGERVRPVTVKILRARRAAEIALHFSQWHIDQHGVSFLID